MPLGEVVSLTELRDGQSGGYLHCVWGGLRWFSPPPRRSSLSFVASATPESVSPLDFMALTSPLLPRACLWPIIAPPPPPLTFDVASSGSLNDASLTVNVIFRDRCLETVEGDALRSRSRSRSPSPRVALHPRSLTGPPDSDGTTTEAADATALAAAS